MNDQELFLHKLIGLIEAAGIDYMVCGSLASSLHGQPRTTNDADIIIRPKEEQLEIFLKSLEGSYYVGNETAYKAMKNRSMFNVIDLEYGWKADLIFFRDSPYSISGFCRKQRNKVMGTDMWLLSPEDSILSKLDWARDSGSQVQFGDAVGVAAVQWDTLDWDYINQWAEKLGINKAVEKVKQEAAKLRGEK